MKRHEIPRPTIESQDILCPISQTACPTLTFLVGRRQAAQDIATGYEDRAEFWRDGPLADLATDQLIKADPYFERVQQADKAIAEIRTHCDEGPDEVRAWLGLAGVKRVQCSVIAEGQEFVPYFDSQSTPEQE